MAVTAAGAAYLGADPRSFDQQQADCVRAITKAKTAALGSMAYTVGGETYTVTLTTQDQFDVDEQLGLLQAATAAAAAASPPQPAPSVEWEIVDGEFLTWYVADLQALDQAGTQHVLGCYSNAGALTAAARTATSADQLPDPSTGWPA